MPGLGRGGFITFEGGEGAGKSTQVRRLSARLAACGQEVVATREPGGSPRAERIREAILSGKVAPLGASAEALMFSAARLDHVETKIRPAIQRGAFVVCDRFIDSTRAYQGVGGNTDSALIDALERVAAGRCRPNLTLLLDLPPHLGLDRARRRRRVDETPDRFEREAEAFHERLRAAFLDIAAKDAARIRVIDASRAPETVADEIWAVTAACFPALAAAPDGTKAVSGDDRGAPESDRFEDYTHPRETGSLIGHALAEMQFLEAFRSGRLPHAWIIGGAEGIGKSTLAWRFARFILAHPDAADDAVRQAADLSVSPTHRTARQVAAGGFGDIALLRREVNEKTGKFYSVIRVDDVRRASSLFKSASRAGGYRICILDSAEDLNPQSANALLKLIEEPPPLSLFLIVSHRPGQLLPTIRSRCRFLALDRLAADEVMHVLRTLGAGQEAETLALAAERGGGSIKGALHWLGGERLALFRESKALLEKLPQTDWGGLHRLGDRVTAAPDDFALLTEAILDWLHERMRRLSASAPTDHRRLAPLAEVWDKVRRSARDAEVFNLDKRATIVSIFADLALATRLP